MRAHRGRWKRDTVIVTFALTLGAIEVLLLGARASTLTFVTGLLLSPLVLRIDEARQGET